MDASGKGAGIFVWMDGQVVPGAQARVPVLDRGFLYGDSVYEVTRTVRGAPLFYEEHLLRLADSAAGLGFALPARAEIDRAVQQTLQELASTCGEPEAYIRIIVTRGAGELDLDPAAADDPRLLVLCKPLRRPAPQQYQEGVAVCTVEARRNARGHVPPEIKSGNYVSSVLGVMAARRRGAYEALLDDGNGGIAEGASSNFFIVRGGRDGVLCTPPLSVGMLAGVTRTAVLAIARAAGIPVQETPLSLEDALAADEALLTSSIRGVLPVTRLNDQPIGNGRPGPLTKRIMALYAQRIGE